MQMIWAQCNELFISEIFYGDVTASKTGTVSANFSLEIFNPKDVSVDLSDYKFKFTAVGETDYYIDLTGTLQDKGKFVVSLATSEATLNALADIVAGTFDFGNYEMLYFEKNGVVIDRFGKDNVTTANYDDFDIATFLTNPAALLNSDINLQSIEGIDLRRHPLKQEGDLTWNGVIDNWYPYTTANFNDVGEHQGICSGASVVGWKNTEKVVNEDAGVVTAEVEISGGNTYLDQFLALTYQIPASGSYPSLSQGLDYTQNTYASSADIDYNNMVEIATIIDDNEWEPYEEVVAVVIYDAIAFGSGQVSVDPQNKELLLIVRPSDEEPAGINSKDLKKQINVYPIVFDTEINIHLGTDIEINSVKLYNDIGKLMDFEFVNEKVLLSNIPSAYYFLLINTNKGVVSYKILKK